MKKLIFLLMTCGMHVCSLSQTEIAGKNIINPDKYVMTPIKGLKKGIGRLNLVFADSVEWSVDIYNSAKKFITNHSILDKRNTADKKNYYDLQAGIYHFKLNTVMIENVPIEEGKETRLRTGVLDITTPGNWELRSEDKKKYLTSGNKTKKIALPVGKYQLGGTKIYRVVEIKDVLYNVTSETANFLDKWVITDLSTSQATSAKDVAGFLDLNFPPQTNWTIEIQKQNRPVTVLRSYEKVKQSHPLPPGHYNISINNVLIENVPIEPGKLTRIKTGLVNMKVLCDSTDMGSVTPFADWVTNWYVFARDKVYENYYFKGVNSQNIILPIGNYSIKVWGSFPLNEFQLVDGETRDLSILTTRLIITSKNLTWGIFEPDPENSYAVNPMFTKPYYEGGNLNGETIKYMYLPVGKYILNWLPQGYTQQLKASFELAPKISAGNSDIPLPCHIRIEGQGYSAPNCQW